MTLGQKLKKLRTDKQMSLDDVANAGGFGKPLLWRIEHGKATPRPASYRKILKGLGILEGSKDARELHALWGGSRLGEKLTPKALTADMSKQFSKSRKEMEKFILKLSELDDDDFEELKKAIERPEVLGGIRALNSIYGSR